MQIFTILRFRDHNRIIQRIARVSLLSLCLLLGGSRLVIGQLVQTDLAVDQIISPSVTIQTGIPVTVKYRLSNTPVDSAETRTTDFSASITITKQPSSETVFGIYDNGTMPAMGSRDFTASQTWTPTNAGMYRITIAVTCSSDVELSNNSMMLDFTVTAAPQGGINTSPVSSANNMNSCSDGDPVNTTTGELYDMGAVPLWLGGPFPLYFAPYYASALSADGNITSALGKNWLHNFDLRFVQKSDTIFIVAPWGRLVRFERSGSTWTLKGNRDVVYRLASVGGSFIMGNSSGTIFYLFDATLKRLSAIRDNNGNTLIMTYDVGGKVSGVNDGLGRQLTFQYDAAGKLSGVADGTRSIAFTHSGDLLTEMTGADGRKTTYTYDALYPDKGLRREVSLPGGKTSWVTDYDATGRVVRQMHPDGTNLLTYTYTSNSTVIRNALGQERSYTRSGTTGSTAQWTDEAGNRIQYQYDAVNRITTVADRKGSNLIYTYHEPSGQISSIRYPDNNVVRFEYTPRTTSTILYHDPASITYADSSRIRWSYDSRGNVLSTTDRAGQRTDYTYDTRGEVLTETNPSGGVTSYTYNTDGTLASRRDPAASATTFTYDPLHRRTGVIHPDGTRRTVVYDNADRTTAHTDERGKTTTYTYDPAGDLTRITDPMGKNITYSYDGMGRVTVVGDAYGNEIGYVYDSLGRVGMVIDQRGKTTRYHYDARGRVSESIDPGGKSWKREYDAEDRVIAVVDPLGGRTEIDRDGMERPVGVDDPLGNRTIYTYDQQDRPTSLTDPLGNTTRYIYDARDLVTITAPEDISVGFKRDATGQVTELTDPNGSSWSYTYDSQERRISSSDPLGNTTTYAYDSRSRMTSTTYPGGLGSARYVYDETSNLDSAIYSDGRTTRYTYDDAGRLVGGDGISFAYDDNGLVIGSNGVVITRNEAGKIASQRLAPGRMVQYNYDTLNRVERIQDWAGGVTRFSYDDAGRVEHIERANGMVTTYSYDASSNVVEMREGTIASQRFSYDGEGKMLTAERNVPLKPHAMDSMRTYSYDAASQITTYTYDVLGRPMSDGSRSYQWDLPARLTEVTESGATTRYTYDGLGEIIGRNEAGRERRFVYSYAHSTPAMVVEREGSNDLQYYIYTPDGELLYSIDPLGKRQHYHYDADGNTLFRSDDAAAVTDAYAYDPYGRMLGRTGTAENRFTYDAAGGTMQEGGGLYSRHGMFYDPATGRSLAREPGNSANPYGGGNRNKFVYDENPGGESGRGGTGGSSAPANQLRWQYDADGSRGRSTSPGNLVQPSTSQSRECTSGPQTPGGSQGLVPPRSLEGRGSRYQTRYIYDVPPILVRPTAPSGSNGAGTRIERYRYDEGPIGPNRNQSEPAGPTVPSPTIPSPQIRYHYDHRGSSSIDLSIFTYDPQTLTAPAP